MLKRSCIIAFAVIVLCSLSSVFAQNLVKGGNMEDESAWNITYFNADQPEYEFNYTADKPKLGKDGCLYLYQGEASGQLLIWQRIKLQAGKTYRATAAIACRDYFGGPEGGGAWYQMYIDPTDVDETASDYNPGETKFLNMDGWQEDFPEIFDGSWESVNLGGGVESAPYYTAPDTLGDEVEVTFGIKFGQYWSDYAGTVYELLVDEVGLYPVDEAINVGGNMEDESQWNIAYFNADQPEYEFNYTADKPRLGRDGNLYLYQGEASGQLLLWQRITLQAGETYRATAAIACRDYFGGPEGGGAWYQLYINPEDVDETASDYNPGEIKFFNMDGWQEDFPEIFDDLWEDVNLGGGVESAPFYTAPDSLGDEVEVTFGIKFGQYWSDYAGTVYELLVDDVYIWNTAYEASTAVDSKSDPVTPDAFVLAQNYPNPFNPTTTISFSLPDAGETTLKVFNMLGAKVATLANGQMQAGLHHVTLDAGNLPSGIYYYTLQQNNYTATKKCVVLK